MNRNLNLANTNKMFGLLESKNNTLTIVARARCSRQHGVLAGGAASAITYYRLTQ